MGEKGSFEAVTILMYLEVLFVNTLILSVNQNPLHGLAYPMQEE